MSSINGSQYDKQAAALSASWPNGFAAVSEHHLLADAGLEHAKRIGPCLGENLRLLAPK